MIYLYVKEHAVTGLKYFGKTTKPDPYTYNGSGTYWNRHINKHEKKYIETIKVWEFTNLETAKTFAINFSIDNDIVKSKEWANLINETAEPGLVKGFKMSDETKEKMSMSKLGIKYTQEAIIKSSINRTGLKRSAEQREKMSMARQKQIRPKHTEETKLKISKANTGKHWKHTKEQKLQKSIRQTGRKHSAETISKMSVVKKGIKPRQTTCPHCSMAGSLTTMHRWHFDNCKTLLRFQID